MKENEDMVCSFCGKSQRTAKRLIANPTGDCYICDECIEICQDIVSQVDENGIPKNGPSYNEKIELPTPKEIKDQLDEYMLVKKMQKKFCLWQFITIIKE